MEQEYLPGDTPQQRLQDLMKEYKITQAELASKIGVAESSISRFLNGTKNKLGVVKKSVHRRKSEVLSGERTLSEACTFDQRWEIIFVGCVAPAAVVVGLDPAEDKVAHQLPWHTGAVEPVDQLFLQRCEKALHARIIKAAMGAPHTLPDGAELRNRRPVFLTGVLDAVVGVQYQTLLVTIA